MTSERDHVLPFESRVDWPYWDGIAGGTLRIQRCARCETWKWPADWRCPACGSYELDWPEVEPVGVVYSWTRSHLPFVAAFSHEVPYINVLVELPQAGGARVLGLLRGTDRVAIGDRVVGQFMPPSPRSLDLATIAWSPAGAPEVSR